MADPQRPNWWTSLPGILTAATGFVAALSGLVAGLSQLGVFERRPAAPQEVAASATPRALAEPEEHTASVPSDSGRAESPPPRPPVAAPAAGDSGSPTPADTAPSRAAVLLAGTDIELVAATRICAPESGYRRFAAKVAAAVRTGGVVVLARNTPAVLRLGRLDGGLVTQLDSLVVGDASVPVRAARTRVRRSVVAGACLKPGARITVSLGAAVTLPTR